MQTDLSNLRKVRPEWADVQRETLLVNLTVARWRARSRNDWQTLGLPEQAYQKMYTPGVRKLLPPEIDDELDRLEGMARDLLKRFAFDSLFGYLMPKAKYFEWRTWLTEKPLVELRQFLYRSRPPAYVVADSRKMQVWETTSLRDRYFQLADEIAANRDVIVDEVANLYDAAIEDIWRRKYGVKTGDPLPIEFWADLDEIKRALVKAIPLAEAIRASFVLKWELAEVETPPEVIRQAKMEELLRREGELDALILDAQDEVERLHLQQEQERVRQEQAITEEIARLRDDQGKRFQAAIDQMIGQLQGEVYEMVLDHLDVIGRNGALPGTSARRIRSVVDFVRNNLSVLSDSDALRQACDQLEYLAESGKAYSKAAAGEVTLRLREIGAAMKADLILAGVPSRSGRDLGISDEPIPDLERGQRAARDADLFGSVSDSPAPLVRQGRVLEVEAAR